ncbi:TPA: hypothetical protein ACK3JP_002099 [Mannheimia haemolytica]
MTAFYLLLACVLLRKFRTIRKTLMKYDRLNALVYSVRKPTFTRAFKQALKELDKGEYQTRESNGRTVTNVRYIDKQRTFNKWQG